MHECDSFMNTRLYRIIIHHDSFSCFLQGIQEVLAKDPQSLRDHTLVIAHNLPENQLREVSSILWGDTSYPPLIVVRSAGFLAEFSVQLHEHTGESQDDTLVSNMNITRVIFASGGCAHR